MLKNKIHYKRFFYFFLFKYCVTQKKLKQILLRKKDKNFRSLKIKKAKLNQAVEMLTIEIYIMFEYVKDLK